MVNMKGYLTTPMCLYVFNMKSVYCFAYLCNHTPKQWEVCWMPFPAPTSPPPHPDSRALGGNVLGAKGTQHKLGSHRHLPCLLASSRSLNLLGLSVHTCAVGSGQALPQGPCEELRRWEV